MMTLPLEPTPRELAIEISHLRELLASKEQALALQAKEYERRLAELNHAHQMNQDRNAEFVLNSSYQADNRATMARISSLELGASSLNGRILGVGIAATVASTLISLLVKFWK